MYITASSCAVMYWRTISFDISALLRIAWGSAKTLVLGTNVRLAKNRFFKNLPPCFEWCGRLTGRWQEKTEKRHITNHRRRDEKEKKSRISSPIVKFCCTCMWRSKSKHTVFYTNRGLFLTVSSPVTPTHTEHQAPDFLICVCYVTLWTTLLKGARSQQYNSVLRKQFDKE